MRLAEFNVSVLVSDAFKAAVADDEEWLLYFHIPPVGDRSLELTSRDFVDDNDVQQYVYSVWRARDLWALITRYTYEFSDPGIIFIDRVNDLNNLSYCETIRCTNPCGEQPLPPDATCNLAAVNVANVIRLPFTPDAYVDYDLLAQVAHWGTRFLDNVIDVTHYPLPSQRDEEFAKRRTGLGMLGLGTAFSELGIRYGSVESVQTARKIMKTIALASYQASIGLAEERGSFPMFEPEIIECGFIRDMLDEDMKEQITEKGLRNGVLLTIAPTGTGAIATGNMSSGEEPDFDHEVVRRVRRNNTEEYDSYTEQSYTKRFYEFCTGRTDIPDYMVTAQNISILDHIKVQSALQEWVDASISKTINIPENMPYEEFVEVYELADQYGLKGCTTYRPSVYRESILTAKSASTATVPLVPVIERRPDELTGTTYKLKWPSLTSSMFVTINYYQDRPYEIFFASKDAKFQDFITGLTLMISAILRSSVDPIIVPRELKQVVSTHDTSWEAGKFYGSLVARIGALIEQDFIKHGVIGTSTSSNAKAAPEKIIEQRSHKDTCPKCTAPALIHKEGCATCENCGYSSCG